MLLIINAILVLLLLSLAVFTTAQSNSSTTTSTTSTTTVLITTALVSSTTTFSATSPSLPSTEPSAASQLVDAPSSVTPTFIRSAELQIDSASPLASLRRNVRFEFTATQFQEWLSTVQVLQFTGRAPPEDQPYGLRAMFEKMDFVTATASTTTTSAAAAAAGLASSQPSLITFISNRALNLTVPAIECFSPNANDKLVVRFAPSAPAVRKYNTTTLTTADYNGGSIPDIEIDVLIEDQGDNPAAGLGVISFTFALICLLYLLSDWTQATVSLMQLQWIIMICMQTCVPVSTSSIVQRSHYILWPLSGQLTPAVPEYAFRILFNGLILVFVLVLEILMIVAFIGAGKDRVTAMQRARFPSLLGVGLAVLLPTSCMFIATRVFSLLNIDSPVAGAAQITYAVLALIFSLIYIVLVSIATFTVVSRLVFRELQPRANRSWFQRLTSPDGEWLVEPAVSARWGLLFDGYSVRGFWVFAAQQLISFIIACAAGPSPITDEGCKAKSYVLLIASVVLAALHFVRKPYNTALANLTNTVVSLAIVILCISVISAQTCSSRTRIFTSSCAWGAILILMLKVLIHFLLTMGKSVHQLLFANEIHRGGNNNDRNLSSFAEEDDLYDDETSGLGGRLLSPFGGQDQAGLSVTNKGGSKSLDNMILDGENNSKSVLPLLHQAEGDGFELRLFSGTDAFDSQQQMVVLDGANNNSHNNNNDGSSSNEMGNQSNQTFISLAPPAGNNNSSASRNLMTMQPSMTNPILIGAGAFLKKEIGFGKMGGLRGSSGPSLVIQLYAPIAVVSSPTSGAVIVLEAGYRGSMMARNGSTGVISAAGGSSSGLLNHQNAVIDTSNNSNGNNNNNNASSSSPQRSLITNSAVSHFAPIPRDAKPRLLTHAPDSRRVEEIVMRDISALRDALGSANNNNNSPSFSSSRSRNVSSSRRRAMQSRNKSSSLSPNNGGKSPRSGGDNDNTSNNNDSPKNNNKDDTMSVNSDQTTATDGTATTNTTQNANQSNSPGGRSRRNTNNNNKSANSSSLSSASPLKLPTAICMGQNCLFVCDADDGSVVRVDLISGLVTTVISDLLKPSGLASMGDRLFVSDTLRHRVLAIDLVAGKVTVVAGTGTAGFDADGTGAGGGVGSGVLMATQSRLNCPQGLSVCPETGELFITDSCNHRVVCLSLSLKTMRTILGRAGVVGDTESNGDLLRAREEVVLSMPTQVISRIAPEASNLDVSSAFAVEIFVIESGNAKIWHVNRFGFAQVILPRNGFLTPYSFCLVPSHQTQTLVSHQRNFLQQNRSLLETTGDDHGHHRSLVNGVELLVVDTHQQIVTRVSIPTLQAASSLLSRHDRKRHVPSEFHFRSPTFERTIPSVGRNMNHHGSSSNNTNSNNNVPVLTIDDSALNEFQSL